MFYSTHIKRAAGHVVVRCKVSIHFHFPFRIVSYRIVSSMETFACVSDQTLILNRNSYFLVCKTEGNPQKKKKRKIYTRTKKLKRIYPYLKPQASILPRHVTQKKKKKRKNRGSAGDWDRDQMTFLPSRAADEEVLFLRRKPGPASTALSSSSSSRS